MDKREWIAFLKNRWGMPAFFYLVLLTALMIYLAVGNGPAYERFLRGRPAFFLSLLSLTAMYAICYVSYSKIFKFKAFLLGHLFFATGLVCAYLSWYMPKFLSGLKETTAFQIIILFMSFNLLMTSLAPVKLRYSITRLIAVIVMATEFVLCFVVFHNASATAASSVLFTDVGFLVAVSFINVSVILLTLILAKEENSFGGVLAALALITIFMAYCMAPSLFLITRFMFFLLPLLVLTGVIVYWFTCLHHRVSYDPLLQIYNRDYAHSIIAGTSRVNLGRPYAIAMVDLDRFKGVNDTYGHPVGDEVLHGTAQCIRQYAMPNGITCRYGGEEIIIFFKNCEKDEAFVICENIRRNVRKTRYQTAGGEFSVSVSIGIADCDNPDVPVERIVKAADEAVYTAKETGRNRVVVGLPKKRVHDPLRRTYLAMKALGRERRNPNP